MAALDFSGVFDEDEKEEVAVKDQQVQSTAASSSFEGVFDDEETTPTSSFSDVFDDEDEVTPTEPEDVPPPSREPSIEETPEDIYMRTKEVPAGYKAVPTVPTADTGFDSLGIKLEPIDAPKPSVAEQTESAFNYKNTKEMIDIYGTDILGAEEFIEDNIPDSIKPVAEWLGTALNKDVANLAVIVEAFSDTAANAGVALTKGLKEVGVDLGFEDREGGEKFAGDMGMALEMIEAAVPGGSTAMAPVRKLFKEAKKKARDKARAEAARQALLNRKMNINKAKEATAEDVAAKTAAAEKVAAENTDLKNELIIGFEEATGKTISREVKGVRVIDDDLARKAGRETAEEIEFEETRGVLARGFGIGEVEAGDAAQLAGVGDRITSPILKPEKLDGLVAAASDLKRDYSEVFDNDKTVIDNLLELTVNKEWGLAGDELLDVLNRYNVSFEDYILAVVGSGSQAGKVLNKLSQIKRARPINEMKELERVATQARQGQIRNNVMRLEGIRRGGLVSQLATAARNLTSAGIRSPLDSLGNVMDTALYNAGEVKGLGSKTKEFAKSVSPTSVLGRENWKGSFANLRYMFGSEQRLDAKDYVEFILDRPELARQYDLMFNQLNELQAATGRGQARQRQIDDFINEARAKAKKDGIKFDAEKVREEAERLASRNFDTFGKGVDKVLSELEDGVSVLNSANRWQEYLVRRGSFLGELERLVQREYKIDLIDTLNDGKIRDLLNDASSVRPEGARSFIDLVADATNMALDVTYAKQPDITMFREITSFITRNGLTVAIPFPRFMFNSMELMGNYAGGASIPLTKKLFGQIPKGTRLSDKDRQRISRNFVGIAAMGAAWMARSQEDAPSDYKELNMGDGTVMDTTPQFPLRQFLYLGELAKRLNEEGPGWVKTVDDWFDAKEFMETFVGTNIRTGVGNSIIEETLALWDGTDLTKDEQTARAFGRAIGNYLSTWMVPFGQIIDSERALGMRGEVIKDTGKDPTLDRETTFLQNLARPSKRFTMTPKEEAALPTSQRLFQEEPSRVASALKVGLGLSLRTKDSEDGEYIKNLGLSEFELASRSKVPSIRRFENEQLRDFIPAIVSFARAFEEDSRDTYRSSPALQKEMTENEFVNSRVRPYIKTQITSAKQMLSDGKIVSADAPEYISYMMAYRRLPPDIRKGAASEFILQEERVPNGASTEDLAILAELGKALKQAYR
tara:strand:- start:164 stop:3781 length:3618 start_codon:yes stop_codon:yes gene_type:complete